MSARRVVVDGSNLATEGRTLPSLAQLDEAVQEFSREYPGSEITVVVDGTFGYRIDESERKTFEEAELAGEIVKVHHDNGQPVQYGEPLFTVRPSA